MPTNTLKDPTNPELNELGNTKINRMILMRFTLFLLLLTALLVALSLPIYSEYETGLKEQLLAQEEVSVVSAKQMIQKEMYEQLHLLDMIVESNPLKNYLDETDSKQNKQLLEAMLKNISASFHRYDQIRVLDNSGQEKVRVNLIDGKAVTVAEEFLQDKSASYYFKAAKKIHIGQIYVSAMDLNVEQGKIVEPYQPTLRFTTPLEDSQGKPKGMLVINYSAKGMLEQFRDIMTQRVDQQGMLLDSQGYWLSNHERSNEWGFDLGKPEHKFASFYPNAWPKVKESKSGTFETDKGVFRYVSIEPLNFKDYQPAHFRIEHQPLIAESAFINTNWKMVIFIPKELINSYSFLYQPLGRALSLLLILLLPAIAFLSAYFSVQRKINKIKDQQLVALLTHRANFDALTGINNRRAFFELGEKELKQAHRQAIPLVALMADADHFKKVNDTYGHAVGDLVLKDLAKTLTNTLRDVDICGRIGGEEFAVLLPHTPEEEALEVAERLREALAARKVPLPDGNTLSFTVSVGLALLTTEDQHLDKLMQKADLALYQAKEQGRNRVVVYQETPAVEEST
ncbi:sensor domain-containing diguanylate cyclase [Marinospirillum insulare]|uniref:diguanylate cyclase n=1 Tax=Marinospirillum insulare TaxID=217169 RepID=A0ABQ5ZYZ2_9GAMM|nr:sensor domain-containing diguanylate cyclase [Marinospirillum insulare]GLR64245.1 GGDEF domain-containing protein [Marinospirillum insulare]